MANYKFVDVDQLEDDLTIVANSIRSKSGKSGVMAFPGGFKSAVEGISTGITVQRKSGTFTTNTSGTATVSCGFKPDMVAIDGGIYSNTSYFNGATFTEANANKISITIPPSTDDSASYRVTSCEITQSSSGFSVYVSNVNAEWERSNCRNRQLSYVAIKYT